ncbi:MAG: nitroreductase, partial [Myxococcota bacterium]
ALRRVARVGKRMGNAGACDALCQGSSRARVARALGHLHRQEDDMAGAVYEALIERRTIHDYSSEPVPEEAVLRALESATRAPNHKLTNPWRFIRVGPQGREAIAALGVELKSRDRVLPEKVVERIRGKLLGAPELIVVTQLVDDDDFREREDYAAISCAIQNMMLSLWSEGIGTKWSTGGVTRDAQTYALLGVPEGERIVGFVWAGYPLEEPRVVPPRRAIEDVLRYVP